MFLWHFQKSLFTSCSGFALVISTWYNYKLTRITVINNCMSGAHSVADICAKKVLLLWKHSEEIDYENFVLWNWKQVISKMKHSVCHSGDEQPCTFSTPSNTNRCLIHWEHLSVAYIWLKHCACHSEEPQSNVLWILISWVISLIT